MENDWRSHLAALFLHKICHLVLKSLKSAQIFSNGLKIYFDGWHSIVPNRYKIDFMH